MEATIFGLIQIYVNEYDFTLENLFLYKVAIKIFYICFSMLFILYENNLILCFLSS